MNADANLVGCLVDRLTTRLPHRTGTQVLDFRRDDIAVITRASLLKISTSAISTVLDALISVLEELTRSYSSVDAQPPHVVSSEIYIFSLIADCCAAHWQSLRDKHGNKNGTAKERLYIMPDRLDDNIIKRITGIYKIMLGPIPEGYVLPAKTLLDDQTAREILDPRFGDPSSRVTSSDGSEDYIEVNREKEERSQQAEPHIKRIVEYMSACNWSASHDYLRSIVLGTRTATTVQTGVPQSLGLAEEEQANLTIMRLLAYTWLDAQRLGSVIQELCSSFLHFRKNFQNTVATVLPFMIVGWIDRYPQDFVRLHHQRRRLDGGADTLFDMTLTIADNNKRRSILAPMQMALLFLVPDVFEVASNLREGKSSGLAKKVQFLETLRKLLRNKNESAGYCFVSLLRVVRHFDIDSDAAIVSYAMDIQDEIRDATFRRSSSIDGTFDQELTTAAFISLTQLSFDSSVESLSQTCLHPSAPMTFKAAIIQSCSYFARQEEAEQFRPLFLEVSEYIRSQLKTMASVSSDMYTGDYATKRKASETSAANYPMVCHMLKFLESSPMTLFENAPAESGDGFYEDVFDGFVACLVSPQDQVRSLASNLAKTLLSFDNLIVPLRKSKKLDSKALRYNFWRMTSIILMSMCQNHTQYAGEATLRSIHNYMDSKLLLIKSVNELSDAPRDIPERIAASTKLETLFLVSLCSADIETCQLVTSCFGLFAEECTIAAASDGSKTAPILRNCDVFEEIASPAFRFTGIVAFQKRIRSLLRRLQYPSAGILDAWEIAFDRWLHLSKDVSATPADNVDDRILSEWRNYSGFLASLGGVCLAENASAMEEPVIGGLRWIDKLSSETHEEPLLSRYLRLSVQLLACGNVRVRETMREVLSTEISPSLYQPLFKALESELEVLFTGALETSGKNSDGEMIFAEQAVSLLKALVDRLETMSDMGAASSVHLGALALNFAKFLEGAHDNANCARVKIKVCQLCEVVMRKKEHLNLRDDVRIRNQLLEYIFGWIARPRSPRADGGFGPGGRHDESLRLQKDLDKACLRSLAELTYRLPLQPGEGYNDAGTSELKSQMFHSYFNRFLSLLNYDPHETYRNDLAGPHAADSAPVGDLAITILSNLLSANIDVGLKHSLSIGYHENVDIRTAFVKVLYNILVQGTEFSNLSDAAVSEKYDELLDLLTHDTHLAIAIATICPSGEVDEVTMSLLNIFEVRGLGFELMEALIKQEIEETENESEILRRNCVATKMLSIYAKWKGAQYLRDTLQKVIERLMHTSKDLDLELDPARGVQSQEVIQKNALQLKVVTKVFIDDIIASAESIPAPFRKICSIISASVMPRFPEAKYTAVGAFVFLRFFCPAIVAPEVEGLVDAAPSKEMRRGLLLIAKVIQNLANNVLFGAKEPYMYPLNDFLTQNIYKVTTFLRAISVPPNHLDIAPIEAEAHDFGSCVALHRFLYDHWDQVRQKLMSQERRDYVRSPAADLVRGRSPILEPLRALIANLGPPPLAVTWNRPQISINTPPAYSRFQHFMLRNAFRATESFVSSRAVYDGGESKDGLSIICVILRNIDSDAIDYDTLLYCYLKIASRLWHRPFGLLIDATCYNGQNEPQDDLFKKLELLSPTELSRQLSRIYVYNMNSAFRKCLRRVLRVATKNEASVFNPGNVDYHLIGSLQDLQAHFHLSQLHLPKETISVVTDTRYVFQPITRLSKTKGKIEVTIKVGSQFVQVTTVKKQEVHPGFRLNATVNDIFRLGEVEESPTSIPTEDDSAFGLRADNGKIVMYFQSPKKTDVLQAIRGAKVKHGKDPRALKSFERLIRPQDVPGTIINLALTNLAATDPTLRLSSYNLLGALCRAFKLKAASKFMLVKDISVPLDPTQFIVNVSKHLAEEEPQLTSDFLNEFFVGWESFSDEQKPLSLAYMSPWLPGLRTSLLGEESDGEKGKEKIAAIFRKLIDVALNDPSLSLTLEHTVWPAIYKEETLLDIFLEEILKIALSLGLYDEQSASLTSIVTAMGTITLRGKIISRLRKALNRSSQRPTKLLPENGVWSEICVLLQFCLALSFDSGVQAQLYLPEIFHLVTMLSNTGSSDVRVIVHRLLINSIHAVCTSFKLDDAKLARLRGTLEALSDARNDIFSPPPPFVRDGASASTNQETGHTLASTEHLAAILFETCSVAAPSVDMSNAWRSRWMSLVASTAFQNNPAIQPRAFTVMGCLAREEVDDDLLYQVLVALRNAVNRFGEDGNSEMLVAIVTCLSKMMTKLVTASRYGLQLFWLAMSLVRLVPQPLFNTTANFLEAVLTNIGTTNELRGDKMAEVLLQGRMQLEEAALPLDDTYGIHFTVENFHFAVCACLVRGLSDTVTKSTALRVLSTFLEITNASSVGTEHISKEVLASPYLGLIRCRAAGSDELKDTLWLSGLNPASLSGLTDKEALESISFIEDKPMLLSTVLSLVDFEHLQDSVQDRLLKLLNGLAIGWPGVFLHVCSSVAQLLDEVLIHCQIPSTLQAAHALLMTLSSNPKFTEAAESTKVLNDILEEEGFSGIWRSCSFNQMQEPDKQCFALTEKLIELIII